MERAGNVLILLFTEWSDFFIQVPLSFKGESDGCIIGGSKFGAGLQLNRVR